jgi:hypothetical protein
MADTMDAWLEGIPPVRQTMVSSNSLPLLFFVLSSIIAALTTWAMNQLVTADKKMGLSMKNLTEFARTEITKDMIQQFPSKGNLSIWQCSMVFIFCPFP